MPRLIYGSELKEDDYEDYEFEEDEEGEEGVLEKISARDKYNCSYNYNFNYGNNGFRICLDRNFKTNRQRGSSYKRNSHAIAKNASDEMNIDFLSDMQYVNVYRVEDRDQKFESGFDIPRLQGERPRWSHIYINGGEASIYQSKPTNRWVRAGARPQDASRNDIFLNFGNCARAVEFYIQKQGNEPHLNFVIKVFQIPQSCFQAIAEKSVHENDTHKYPKRPYNVDRKTWNQFGLREEHVRMIMKNIIPGSARTLDPEVAFSSLTKEEKSILRPELLIIKDKKKRAPHSLSKHQERKNAKKNLDIGRKQARWKKEKRNFEILQEEWQERSEEERE